MAKRKQFFVNPRNDGNWEVKGKGSSRASAVASTKEEAVKKGAEIARNAGHSQLLIRKLDGEFQEERTYGKDPHPPKG